MKLITFQSIKVLDIIEENGVYYPPDYSQYGKYIFCLALDERVMETLYYTSPSMPQTMLILDVSDERVKEQDYINWINELCGLTTEKVESNYKEYLLNYIKQEDIIDKLVITTDPDPDIVQDKFMNTHYPILEELSGHKWYRLADKEILEFWETSRAARYVYDVTHVMSPMDRPVTIQDVDNVVKDTKNIFMIH